MTDTAPSAEASSEKTRYLRDPKNPNRVVTVITRVTGNVVEWATAVNSPNETRSGNLPDRPGDRFTKKMGVRIARGRLGLGLRTATPFDPATQHPFVVALNDMASLRTEDGKTTSIARIARAEMARMADILKRRAEWKFHAATLTGADRESM